ncbi:hypothetical protein [Zavarzinia aquatilis]|uniref:hypothetical protein n=1 Tax=Zavarzinia aquatilis TaxID=2211142 RepID=UPI0010580EE2|nr:hypothetical protein [Zavarzinia aquatilis]
MTDQSHPDRPRIVSPALRLGDLAALSVMLSWRGARWSAVEVEPDGAIVELTITDGDGTVSHYGRPSLVGLAQQLGPGAASVECLCRRAQARVTRDGTVVYKPVPHHLGQLVGGNGNEAVFPLDAPEADAHAAGTAGDPLDTLDLKLGLGLAPMGTDGNKAVGHGRFLSSDPRGSTIPNLSGKALPR